MTQQCMAPNDTLADLEHQRAIAAVQQGDFQNAAWHETAAAHLTTARRPRVRGLRAFQACTWWRLVGQEQWAQGMARAFLTDRCISRPIKTDLKMIAQGREPEVTDGLGLRFVGPGAGFVSVVSWLIVAGCAFGVYKLGRYVITGSFGPAGTGKLPAAWEVHG